MPTDEDGLAGLATVVKLMLEFIAVLCVMLGPMAEVKRARSERSETAF